MAKRSVADMVGSGSAASAAGIIARMDDTPIPETGAVESDEYPAPNTWVRPRDADEYKPAKYRNSMLMTIFNFIRKIASKPTHYLGYGVRAGTKTISDSKDQKARSSSRSRRDESDTDMEENTQGRRPPPKSQLLLEGNLEGISALKHLRVEQAFATDPDFEQYIKQGPGGDRAVQEAMSGKDADGYTRTHHSYDVERFGVQKMVFLWKLIMELRATAEAWTESKYPYIAAIIMTSFDILEGVMKNWIAPKLCRRGRDILRRADREDTKRYVQQRILAGKTERDQNRGAEPEEGGHVGGPILHSQGLAYSRRDVKQGIFEIECPDNITSEIDERWPRLKHFMVPLNISAGGYHTSPNEERNEYRGTFWGNVSRDNLIAAGVLREPVGTLRGALKQMMAWCATRPMVHAIPPSCLALVVSRSHLSCEERIEMCLKDAPNIRFMGLAREVVEAYQDGFFDMEAHEREEIDNMADGIEKQAALAQRLMTRYLDVMAWQIAAPTSIAHLLNWDGVEVMEEPVFTDNVGRRDDERMIWIPIGTEAPKFSDVGDRLRDEYTEKAIPAWLFHGTTLESLWSILSSVRLTNKHPCLDVHAKRIYVNQHQGVVWFGYYKVAYRYLCFTPIADGWSVAPLFVLHRPDEDKIPRLNAKDGQIGLSVDNIRPTAVILIFTPTKTLIEKSACMRPKHPVLGESTKHEYGGFSSFMEKHPIAAETMYWRFNVKEIPIIGPPESPLPERPINWDTNALEYVRRKGLKMEKTTLVETLRHTLVSAEKKAPAKRGKAQYFEEYEQSGRGETRFIDYLKDGATSNAPMRMPWTSFIPFGILRRCLTDITIAKQACARIDEDSEVADDLSILSEIMRLRYTAEEREDDREWRAETDVDEDWTHAAKAWAAIIGVGMAKFGSRSENLEYGQNVIKDMKTYLWMFDYACSYGWSKAADLIALWATGGMSPMRRRIQPNSVTKVYFVMPQSMGITVKSGTPLETYLYGEAVKTLIKAHFGVISGTVELGDVVLCQQGSKPLLEEIKKLLMAMDVARDETKRTANVMVVVAPVTMMEKAETQTCNDLKHRRSSSNKKTGGDDDDRGEWPELKDLLTKANANMVWVGYRTKDQCGGYAPGNDAMAAYTKFVQGLVRYKVLVVPLSVLMPRIPKFGIVSVTGEHGLSKGYWEGGVQQYALLAFFAMLWPMPNDLPRMTKLRSPSTSEVVRPMSGSEWSTSILRWITRWAKVIEASASGGTRVVTPMSRWDATRDDLHKVPHMKPCSTSSAAVHSLWSAIEMANRKVSEAATSVQQKWYALMTAAVPCANMEISDDVYEKLRGQVVEETSETDTTLTGLKPRGRSATRGRGREGAEEKDATKNKANPMPPPPNPGPARAKAPPPSVQKAREEEASAKAQSYTGLALGNMEETRPPAPPIPGSGAAFPTPSASSGPNIHSLKDLNKPGGRWQRDPGAKPLGRASRFGPLGDTETDDDMAGAVNFGDGMAHTGDQLENIRVQVDGASANAGVASGAVRFYDDSSPEAEHEITWNEHNGIGDVIAGYHVGYESWLKFAKVNTETEWRQGLIAAIKAFVKERLPTGTPLDLTCEQVYAVIRGGFEDQRRITSAEAGVAERSETAKALRTILNAKSASYGVNLDKSSLNIW